MNDRTYTYLIHIATTPVQLWDALTSNESWQKYWGGEWRIESSWKAGDALKFFTRDGQLFSQGEVIENRQPRFLSYTWPSPEEKESLPEKLSWEITASGPSVVQLKLVHERLSEEYFQGVSQGWPAVLSSLKSLLETGRPLELSPNGE